MSSETETFKRDRLFQDSGPQGNSPTIFRVIRGIVAWELVDPIVGNQLRKITTRETIYKYRVFGCKQAP